MNSFPSALSRLALTALIACAPLATLAMAQGASEPSTVEEGGAPALTESASVLVGHWKKTLIQLEQPFDYHLVLNDDGTFQEWVASAAGTDAPTSGSWQASDTMLMFQTDGNGPVEAPWTIYEGRLIYPNIDGRRGDWERME